MENEKIEDFIAKLKKGVITPEQFQKHLDESLEKVADVAREFKSEESVVQQRIRVAANKARRL